MSDEGKKKGNPGCAILLVIAVVGLLWFGANSLFDGAKPTEQKEIAYDEITNDMKAHLMAYTEIALDDYYYSPNKLKIKYERFVRTDPRYKVEGKVNTIKYTAIFDWDYKDDSSVKLVYLRIGDVDYVK